MYAGITTLRDIARTSCVRSLGLRLVLNQPLLVRVPAGVIYLFVFPIPMWSGFANTSAYHWFKSMNVVLLYFVLPALVLAGKTLWSDASQRSAQAMFLVFVTLGMSMAIAATSLETRHWGAFLVPMFLLCLVPDLAQPKLRRRYNRYLVMILGSMAGVHLVRFVLKVNLS